MNHHYAEAEHLLIDSSPDPQVGLTERQITAARAQTQATLALAYEQRTANLIAFERAQWDAWRQDELNPEGVELWRRAAEQVNERLGLE